MAGHTNEIPDPDALVEIASTVGEFEANIVAARLESEGIQAQVFRSVGSMLGCGPIVTKDVVRVMVRAADAEAARAALQRAREESIDLDWSDVDVGVRVEEAPRRMEAEAVARSLRTMGIVLLVLVALGLALAAVI